MVLKLLPQLRVSVPACTSKLPLARLTPGPKVTMPAPVLVKAWEPSAKARLLALPEKVSVRDAAH